MVVVMMVVKRMMMIDSDGGDSLMVMVMTKGLIDSCTSKLTGPLAQK